MIADGCNESALVGFRSGRRRRRAFRLFHYYPSARGDELEFTEQCQNVGAHVVLERRIDKYQIERLVRSSKFPECAMHLRHDDAGAIRKFKL